MPPLHETISPLPESGDDVPMSPSRYPAPPVPAMDISVSETWLSPSQSQVVNTLSAIDVFPPYTMSPVTLSLLVDSDYVSPGSPASMDHFLTGDRLLMDGPSDLRLLQLPLLPLPDAGVSPPGLVAGPPWLDDHPSSASASPDLSREGPFDAHLDTAATGNVPLVLDSLPGCQYRMTSYDPTEVADVDPAHGLQLHHLCFLEYVRAPESAGLLSRPPAHWIETMDRCPPVATRRRTDHVYSTGVGPVCDVV